MSGYEERINGFNINQGDTGWTGQREFLTKAGAASTIPEIGDVFPSGLVEFTIPSGLTARNISAAPFNTGTGLSDVQMIYTVAYSTKQDGGTSPDPEDEPHGVTIGAEVMQLETNGSDSVSNVSGGTNKTTTIYAFVPTATYTKTEIYDTLQLAIDSLGTSHGKVLDINAPLTTASDGYWLCMGIDVDEFFDNDGNTKYAGTRSYMYRRVTIKKDAAVKQTGWNAIWDPAAGEFKITNPLVYGETVGSFPDTMPTIG